MLRFYLICEIADIRRWVIQTITYLIMRRTILQRLDRQMQIAMLRAIDIRQEAVPIGDVNVISTIGVITIDVHRHHLAHRNITQAPTELNQTKTRKWSPV